MTTEPEVPMSAEEIEEPYGAAILAKFALCVARKCGHDITHHVGIPRRYLATIDAKDARITELEWERIHETDRANLNAVCAESLKSQLRDANRRTSELFDELEAAQNAAEEERVVLKAKLAHVQERRELAVAELMRQREALESKLREATADRDALLGLAEPWPLKDVLSALADLARREMRCRTLDFHGHEAIALCIQRASDIIEGIDWNHPAALQSAQKEVTSGPDLAD